MALPEQYLANLLDEQKFIFFKLCFPSEQVTLKNLVHDTISLGTCEQFTATLSVRHKEVQLNPQGIMMLDAGEVHHARTMPMHTAPHTFKGLQFTEDVMKDFYYQHTEKHFPQIDLRAVFFEDPHITAAYQQLYHSYEMNFAQLERETLLLEFFNLLAQKETYSIPLKAKFKCYVLQAMDYLRANFNRNVSLKELSEMTGMNSFVLLRHFKRQVGVAPHEYLLSYRINQARALLHRGVKAIEVAFICGFTDQSHLTRTFKRVLGCSPKQYLPL